MKSSKYLVTGATGFIGKELCQELVSAGHAVSALVRSFDYDLFHIGVNLIEADLSDVDILAKSVVDFTHIVHCAGNASFGDGDDYYSINTDLTKNLIQACSLGCTKLDRFVFISTVGAVDRSGSDNCSLKLNEASECHPSSDYGKSKLLAEKLVVSSGLPYSIIRPSMVVGRRMRYASHFSFFARSSIAGSLFSKFKWPGVFSIVHVSDLVAAIIVVAENKKARNEIYFCGGEDLELDEFFNQCSPGSLRVPLGLLFFFLRPFRRFIPFKIRALYSSALTVNDSKLRKLGWEPTISVLDIVSEIVQRERGRLDWRQSVRHGYTVITGAASGLGLALYENLKNHRANIVLIDIDESRLSSLAAAAPNCSYIVADLSSIDEISALLASAEWNSMEISELYACAGVGFRGAVQELDTHKHVMTYSLNVISRLMLGRNVVPRMQKVGFGRIVMVSSSSAFQPLPYMASYASSNAALLSLTEAWQQEISGTGIQLMCVCPGGMKTNFQKSAGVKELQTENLMTPSEVADQILSAVNGGKTTVFVSLRTYAMSLLARLLPRKLSVLLWSKLMEKMR